MEVGLLSLWLPILVSTVFVFILGFFLYMVLPHHRTDFERIEEEERFSVELQNHKLKKGLYSFPYAASPVDTKDPEYQKRVETGPVGLLIIGPNEVSPSRKQLAIHLLYIAVLTAIVAYIAGQALGPGTEYLKVFQIVGATSFVAFAGGCFVLPIWFHFGWSMVLKTAADSAVFSLATAGIFAWLWPM